MANQNLAQVKSAKNDEFYTQYHDIEKEVNAYLEFDPDTFRDKVVLLPCDDPEWSNFTIYFAQNFERLGLKRLVSTSYAPDSKLIKTAYQPTLFESSAPQFDASKTQIKGKIFTLDKDKTGDGRIDVNDLEWHYLEGDGDFRSKEISRLRDEADIIVTNPPFSLFRDFLAWIVEADKKFLIIGNKNCLTYKEVFPLFKDNKIWIGKTPMSEDLLFGIPKTIADELVQNGKEGSKYRIVDGQVLGRSTSVWFTNLDHGRRHQPLPLMTMADNLKFSKHKEIKGKTAYDRYDNYDAIEVPYTDAIPSDYEGLMGVPISFLDKFCPDQFEIITMGEGEHNFTPTKFYKYFLDATTGQKSNAKRDYQIYVPNPNGAYITDEGTRVDKAYKRIIIRKKQ